MTLEQALEFLAINCPQVFKPISEEMNKLREELNLTQDAVNSIIFNAPVELNKEV